MFEENPDINDFLSPAALPTGTFSAGSFSAHGATLEGLFGKLSDFLSNSVNEKSALRQFIEDHHAGGWLEEGFASFEMQFLKISPNTSADLATLYNLAGVSFEENRIDDAVLLLTVISTIGEAQAAVLAAMAACACRQEKYRHGFELAKESIVYKDRHPRTHLMAGYCALKLKDTKNAKRFLALTSRLARQDPQFANEQRCAQRELLMLQFSS